jgi:hypothetical protein
MINELERMWEEAVMAQFEVISQQGHDGTEEIQVKLQSEQMVSWLISELGIYPIQTRSITV